MLQRIPSQCSIKVCLAYAGPPGCGPKPTAQMSLAETTATALSLAPRLLFDTSMAGLGTTCQVPVTGVGVMVGWGVALGVGVAVAVAVGVGVGVGLGRASAAELEPICDHRPKPASNNNRPGTWSNLLR